jgi:hypothetical protein
MMVEYKTWRRKSFPMSISIITEYKVHYGKNLLWHTNTERQIQNVIAYDA